MSYEQASQLDTVATWRHCRSTREHNEVRSKHTSKRKTVTSVLNIWKRFGFTSVTFLSRHSVHRTCSKILIAGYFKQIKNWSLHLRRPDLHINCRFGGRHCTARKGTHGSLIGVLDIRRGGTFYLLFLVLILYVCLEAYRAQCAVAQLVDALRYKPEESRVR